MKKKMVERHCLSNSRSIVVITQVHVGHVLDCTCQLFPFITSFNPCTTPRGFCVTEGKLRLRGKSSA